MLRSVNVTVTELQPEVGVPEKLATGAAIEQLDALSATIGAGPQLLATVLRDMMSLPPAVSLMAVNVLRSVLGPTA